ncbi:MAG TPA: lipid-A-disaccharide synthase [Xanthobacteraceae bacterium]|nr:lipid-A-disaccharide synthase [Xanthobacteraceae bacterium]
MNAARTPAGADARDMLMIHLVAGEESGDRLGAALMRALMERCHGRVRFAGVGGHDMTSAGLDSLFPIDDLAIMGFSAIPRRLPMILRRIRAAAAAAVADRPDALVVIDSPDFTHRVARRVRAAAPDVPIIDYVSPSVWAWRPGRARAMRAYVDHVLAILPFEPQVHARLGGPPCSYVGHPLAAQVRELRPNEAEARRRAAEPPLVLVLPGSRPSEIRRLIGPFGQALRLAQERYGTLELVLPTVPALLARLRAATAEWPMRPRITAEPAEKRAAFRQARAALAASGTVTLELALAAVPSVGAYRVGAVEGALVRALMRPQISVRSVILANLVLGANVVPEFLQGDCTPPKLADALVPLLGDPAARRRQLEAFAKLDAIMGVGAAPGAKAADVVLDVIGQARAARSPAPPPGRSMAQRAPGA